MTAAAGPDGSPLALQLLYDAHYRPLVRLAAFLVGDSATAEDVVQDVFVAMYAGCLLLRHADNAAAYLRRSVINRSRSVLRRRAVENMYAPAPPPDALSAEQSVLTALEAAAVVHALRGLPPRQREALVLRYYVGLTEADVAAAMSISKGSVKSHTARGRSALRMTLEPSGR
jgi:RNA polymerase sigma-70 factor (sigma-E family)